MTSKEEKLLQAKHRLEEAQARDQVKERKARIRWPIQKGAVLERMLPEVQTVGLSNLEEYLWRKLAGHDWKRLGSPREVGGLPLLYPEGHAYSPSAKTGNGSPPAGRARALFKGDCGSCGNRQTGLHLYQAVSPTHAVGAGVSILEAPVHEVMYCHPIPSPTCINLPPAAQHRYRGE